MKKFCSVGVVGLNAAHMCGCEINLIDRVRAESIIDRMMVGQIKFGAAGDNRFDAISL